MRLINILFLAALASVTAGALEVEPNTWKDAKTRHIPATNSIPRAWWDTGDGYCAATYRTKSGCILSRTGVKSLREGYRPGFYSNATLEWDLKKNEARVVEVSNWGGGSSGRGRLLPAFKERPTPSPRHTYDGITYVGSQDAMYLMLGANWRIGGNGCTDEAKKQLRIDNKSTWKYSFADGRWTRIDSNVNTLFKVSAYENHMQWWPEGNKLIYLNSKGNRYAEFDLEAGEWKKVDLENKCPQSLYHARSTWDSKRQLWVFRLGPKCCTFDPAARTFQALPAFTDEQYGDGDKRSIWKGIAYIPKHDVYLITGPTGNDTWVYEIEKGKWKNIKGGDIKLPNGYAQYDPTTDLVGLVIQLKNYVFRYTPE